LRCGWPRDERDDGEAGRGKVWWRWWNRLGEGRGRWSDEELKVCIDEGGEQETLVWFQKEGGGRPLCTGKGRLAAAPGSLWFAKRERGGGRFCFALFF